MDLLHSGYKSTLIKLDCEEEFEITIQGDAINKKALDLKKNINVEGHIFIDGEYAEKTKVKTITSFGELVENNSNIMMPAFFENGKYQIAIENKKENEITIIHMDTNLENDLLKVGNVKVGIIEFSSDIGYSTFDIFIDGKRILSLTIEIFPTKIDYFKDYKEIIKEVNDEICGLAFEFLGKTYVNTKLIYTDNQSNNEFINILKIIFDDIERALKRIENNTKHKVESTLQLVNSYKAKSISNKTIDYIRKHPSTLAQNKNGRVIINDKSYMPNKVIEVKKQTTTNIFENRYVKYMITSIIRRLKYIEKSIIKNYDAENSWINFIRQKTKILDRHLKEYFKDVDDLKEKKSMTLVFQMAPGYKEIYKKYILLNKGLDIGKDLYKITPKKIYRLYEVWCYLKLHNILKDLGYEVTEYGIARFSDNGLYFSLLQNEEAKMTYKNDKSKLELWYNKSYLALPTTNQRPDTVLCIKNVSDTNDDRIYIFDAKYRISIDANGKPGPVEDDINVMHRYRDSIVSELDNKVQFKYKTFGAYVMFPYSDEKQFMSHKFYKSIDKVNIGAFPMLPGSTALITKHLKNIVNGSNLEARSQRVVLDEYDDYSKFKLENVMVANVKDEKHCNSYVKGLFYHIPKKHLSSIRSDIEYVAFYQSNKSFNENSGIKYYGKIKDVIEYKRSQCKEIECRKGNENEDYIRMNFEWIKEIPRIEPIQYGTQIVTYTTVYLLLNAQNTHELKYKSNLEIIVYKKIKKIADKNNYSIKKLNNSYHINNNVVEILEGKITRVNGKIVKFSELENYL
ncbi:MAG: restriction endonuclease-like protein [Clostridium beijerinckii]